MADGGVSKLPSVCTYLTPKYESKLKNILTESMGDEDKATRTLNTQESRTETDCEGSGCDLPDWGNGIGD